MSGKMGETSEGTGNVLLRVSSCLATILVKNLCCELKRFYLLTVWWFYLALLRFKPSGVVFMIYHYSSWETLNNNFIISWNNWSLVSVAEPKVSFGNDNINSMKTTVQQIHHLDFDWASPHQKTLSPGILTRYASSQFTTDFQPWQHLFSQTHPVHVHVHFHYHLTHHHHHHQHYLFLSKTILIFFRLSPSILQLYPS